MDYTKLVEIAENCGWNVKISIDSIGKIDLHIFKEMYNGEEFSFYVLGKTTEELESSLYNACYEFDVDDAFYDRYDEYQSHATFLLEDCKQAFKEIKELDKEWLDAINGKGEDEKLNELADELLYRHFLTITDADRDANELKDAIIKDVIEDVKEMADKKFNGCDIDIAFVRVLKKRLGCES